jgi:GNAT superfamily N-acetyltransferase
MSELDWWALPRLPGWKYEYSFKRGAETQIRPFARQYKIKVEQRSYAAPCEIRSVKWRDRPALRQAFSEAFAGYTDYLYASERQLLRLGGGLLREFFSRPRDELCRRASCIAVEPGTDCVIGAALLAPTNEEISAPENATQLQPVFVTPTWQRRGVATSLVSEVLHRLWQAGQAGLTSGCSDYNTASKQWHLRFGVMEILHYFARIPIFRWGWNEIVRKRYLLKTYGVDFDPAEMAKLERYLICLADELDALREPRHNHSYRSEADHIVTRSTN